MMNSRSIGKLISVNQRGIVAEVSKDISGYINTIDGVHFVGEVGSYVSINDIGRIIIGEIVGIEEKTQYTDSGYNKPVSSRFVIISLIGEIVADEFFFGVSKMPLIYSEVQIVSERELQIMLGVNDDEELVDENSGFTKAKSLAIGSSVIFPDCSVKVNIDKFFGFHFAVFGNTGSGKSNTIATIIQNVFIKTNYSAKGAKFVIIDSNGEYQQAFSELSRRNPEIRVRNFIAADGADDKKLEIPVWALSSDDWAVLLHASEKTQIPVLERAIDIAKIFYCEDNNEVSVKLRNHILASTLIGILNSSDSSPSKGDKIKSVLATFHTAEISLTTPLEQDETKQQDMTLGQAVEIYYGNFKNESSLIDFLRKFIINNVDEIFNSITDKAVTYTIQDFSEAVQFAMFYEGSISSQRIQEYTSTLITRLRSLQEGIQGKILTKTNYKSVDDYVADILVENQVVNIDVSSLDDATAEVVAKVMAKLLLDYLKSRPFKADMPINFVVEEAHRYIRNESNYGALGYNIFERIAKEGRKYGLLLGISSQRPSELSRTVVSQCSNFIVHRVQNPDDLQYISKMIPYVNQGMIDRLTYLQTGHALVFGSAINIPTLTSFAIADPRPDSDNAKVSEKWYIA